jgi:molybdopterin/thiamine biosynthesis adenylyltransferase
MITPAQENERMLARVLGVAEDAAAARLSRTFAVTAGPGEAALFAEELTAQLERTICHVPAGDQADLEIVIGTEPSCVAAERLFVTIGTNAVAISRQPGPSGPSTSLHGVQRMIAACYTASVGLAALIIGIEYASPADPFIVRFDALGATRDVLSVPIELDDTVLAGAGAVGNGFLRAARHLTVSGTLTVADPKVVGAGNPNRCLYFTETDVGKPKALALADRAQPDFPALTLSPFIGTFNEIVAQRRRVRRVIVGTDSRIARRSIQNDLPFEVLDASTTGISEIIVHSHRQPNRDACLACIYPHIPDELARARDIAAGLGVELSDVTDNERINARVAKVIASKHQGLHENALIGKAFDSLFKQLCAEQALLTATGEQVLAPFAFVSNLAGALLALELARMKSRTQFADGKNYFFGSPWAPPHGHMRRVRPRLPTCESCGRATTKIALSTVWPELKGGV